MSLLDRLAFGFSRKLPLLLQTEATECGLACLGMVAGFHGHRTDLATLRRQFPVSLKGATLVDLIQVASRMQLASRALRLDMQHLRQLALPCILHWNLNHFVVLKEINARSVVIHDPGFGIRTLPLAEVSAAFTGIALELWPNPEFRPRDEKQRVSLRSLMGQVHGLGRSLGQVLLLALSLEVFTVVSPFFLQWVIDNVIVSADRDLLVTLAFGFGLLALMQQAVAWSRSWVLIYLGTTLNVQWRANILTHMLRLPVQYYEKRHVGDVVSRVGAVDQIQHTLTTSFLEAMLDGAMTIVIVTMMLVYSPMLSSIALLAMLLYAAGRWVGYGPLRNATEEQIVHAAKQQSHLLETIRGVKVIKLFQRQEERRSSWLTLLIDQINADLRTQKLQLLFKTLNGVLFGLENVIILWLGAKLVLDGHFTVGVLLAFVAYKTQFATRVAALIDKGFEIKMLQLYGERLADIVLAEPEQATPAGLAAQDAMLAPTIETRGLRYRYSDSEPYVLNGVDLKIAAGESVAIVGPSGCGKSTLLNVLLGILPPSEGEVLVGGVNMRTLGLDSVRQMVGTVLQDDVLFAGSIAENISFFTTTPDREWIAECARMASVSADIEAMPMGYNTMVGDMGTVMSGGQKQRVLLARALYRRPKILLLDEATSHLDVKREQEVNQAISALQITRIIIAHRPETIASAGRVIELRDGAVSKEPTLEGRDAQTGLVLSEA
jgi:ATP-binding cassette subfamily B protein RaxB